MQPSALPDLYFGTTSVLLASFILPIWLLKILAINVTAFLIRPSINFWQAGPLTWCCWCVETSISAVLNSRDETPQPLDVIQTAEYQFAGAIVNQVMSRVQAAASEVLMHAYATRRNGQIHIDMSEGNSGDSSRAPEVPDDNSDTEHIDAETDRRRTQFARLRQTISQNEDAQTICTFFTALLPFVCLFTLKAIVDNYGDLIRLLTGFSCFVICDGYIQAVVAAGRPTLQQRGIMCIGLVLGSVATSNTIAPVEDYNLWKALSFQYAGNKFHYFWTTLLLIILTDNFVKFLTCLMKLGIFTTPCVTPHQKRRNFQCTEYLSQFYRCALPIAQWVHYFLGESVDNNLFYFGLASVYTLLKLRELYFIGQAMVQSFQRVFEVSNYGVTPTHVEIDSIDKCAICHDSRLVSPTKLTCGHIFCHSCIDTWLDKEHTCPNCRAVIDKKDNHYKTGATSKLIRFY